jgi:hypothetical protein
VVAVFLGGWVLAAALSFVMGRSMGALPPLQQAVGLGALGLAAVVLVPWVAVAPDRKVWVRR